MKQRFVHLFLPLFLTALILSGCQDTHGTASDSVDASSLETLSGLPGQIVLASENKSEYTIVRAEKADSPVVQSASALYKAFVTSGIEIKITTDDWDSPAADPAGGRKKEILIGLTNREESIEAAAVLRADEYSISVKNGCVVICGGSPEATAEACDAFIAEFLSSDINGELLLAGDTYICKKDAYPIDSLSIGGIPITDFSIAYTGTDFKEAADLLQQELASSCGWRLEVLSMIQAKKENKRIICVGLPENNYVLAGAGASIAAVMRDGAAAGMYAVEQKDGTLVLAGKSGWTTSNAVLYFSSNYLHGKTGKVDIGDISVNETVTNRYPVYPEADFRIMTLNTLGAQENYTERFPYMIDLIRQYLPDVIGLQEANKTVQSYVIKPLLEFYEYNQRWHDNGEIANYTPILYRKDKFKLLEAGVRFLRSSYKGTNTKSISWAVLSPLDGSPAFIVTNLHAAMLSSSYGIPGTNEVEGAEWRADNIREMLEIISELRAKYGMLPSFSTGDYNFYRQSKGYAEAVKGGLLNPEIVSTVSSMDGMGTNHKVGAMPTSKESIDRIFISDGITSYIHRIVTDENALKASDHCAVYIDFKIPH